MQKSIHDNNLYGYTVICDRQRIVLHTEYKDGPTPEYTDVVFAGVVAHHFASVLRGNILFGIDPVEPEVIVEGWAGLFSGENRCGWPDVDYEGPSDLISILKQRGIKGFEISSSYGMNGWVLAASMELSEQTARRELG